MYKKIQLFMFMILLGLALMTAMHVFPVSALEVEQPVQEEQALQESMTLQEIFETGGWLMYVLGAMSILGLAMVVYFLTVLRRDVITPENFHREVRDLLSQKKLDEAYAMCRNKPSPLSAITTAALEYAERTEDPDPSLMKEVIEGEGSRQATLIQNQIQYLLDIGVIAPMVGLLGTVIGMLQTFNAVALDIAKVKPMVLAAGVSKALITTAAGLMVGIPAMIFYAYFRGRSSKLLSSLEISAADLLTHLVRKKS